MENQRLNMIQNFLREGEILNVERILSEEKEWTKELIILNVLLKVFRKEVEKNVPHTVFDVSLELNELVEHFVHLKVLIRRVEFELPCQYQKELYYYCVNTGVSDYLLLYILHNNIFFKKRFCKNFSRLIAEEEGENSVRSTLWREMAGVFEEENK